MAAIFVLRAVTWGSAVELQQGKPPHQRGRPALATVPGMKIDFVSDVSCPWCAIGLKSLEQALARMPELKVDLHFQPFELNPGMVAEGEDIN